MNSNKMDINQHQFEKIINNQSKKNLVQVCRELNYGDLNRLNKKQIIEILISKGKNEAILSILAKYNYIILTERPKNQKSKLKQTIGLISAIITILMAIPYVINQIQSSMPKEKKQLSLRTPLFKNDNNSFKILISSFNPVSDCINEVTQYENELYLRYSEIGEKYGISVECKSLLDTCIYSLKQAIEVGTFNNADLVIWGEYDENCTYGTDVRIGYSLMREFNISKSLRSNETDFMPLVNPYDLRMGYLQENIDKILLVTKSIILINQSDFESIYQLLTKSEFSSDIDIQRYIAFAELNTHRYDSSIVRYNNIINYYDDKTNILINRASNNIYLHQYKKAQVDLDSVLDQNNERVIYNKALINYNLGEIDKSIEKMNILLKSNDSSIVYLNHRGLCYYDKGEFDLALQDFNKSISINKNSYALTFREKLYRQKGLFKSASNDLSALNEIYHDRSMGDRLLGYTYYSMKKYNDSKPFMEELNKSHPDNIETKYILGMIYTMLGNYNKAIQILEELRENRVDYKYVYELANLYNNIGQYELALEKINSSVTINSKSSNLLALEGLTYMNLGDYSNAKLAFERALSINPKNSPALNNLGNIYTMEGKYEESILSYTKAFNADKTNYIAVQNLMLIKNDIGITNYNFYTRGYNKNSKTINIDNSEIEFLDSLLYYDNNNYNNYITRSQYSQKEKKNQESILYANKALQINPMCSKAYAILSANYLELNQIDSSLIYIDKSLKIDPRNFEYLFFKANIYKKNLMFDEAFNLYTQIDVIYKHYKVAYEIGNYYYNKSAYSKAIEYYMESIKLNPNYSSSLSGIAEVYKMMEEYELALDYSNKAIVANKENCVPYSIKAEIFAKAERIDSFYIYTELALKHGFNLEMLGSKIYNQFRSDDKFKEIIEKYDKKAAPNK